MQTRCGYTPQQARETTWLEYLDLAAYWSRHIPPDVSLEILARLWGWKPPPPPVPDISFDEAVKAEGGAFASPTRFFMN